MCMASCNASNRTRLALVLTVVLIGGMAVSAYAELQNVEVGAEIRTRGRYYVNTFVDGFAREVRIPGEFLPRRPIGPRGVSSIFKWDDRGPDWKFLETALQLNVRADFTNDVGAFIELYDYFVWGEDFRSNWVTGADSRANTSDDVEINQAYIDVDNLWGTPLRLRVGRQALKFGKGWLVCDMLTPTQRLSFDAVRLTYDADDFTVDAFASKLFESGNAEEDGDVDFYGVYATYKGLDFVQLSAYWYWLRDARAINDTNFLAPVEWIEDLFSLDDYDPTNLHTVGIRANGRHGGFDYDLELAYQFGEADAHGSLYAPLDELYGDTRAKYDNWGAELTVGYTFEDIAWRPRPFVMGVYFGGEDNRDLSLWEWANPFHRPQASVSFNRLFSDVNYMPVVNDNGWLSNVYQLTAGIEAQPTEKIRVHFHVARDWIDEPFNAPKSVSIGDYRIPIAPALSFWTDKGSDDIGWEAAMWVKYNYSDDLWFLLYGNYLWLDDGLTDGAFIQFNGTDFCGGSASDDGYYVFWMAVLKF